MYNAAFRPFIAKTCRRVVPTLKFFHTFAPMKRNPFYIIIYAALLAGFCSCREKTSLNPNDKWAMQDSTENTAIVYMIGEESGLSESLESDIQEMTNGKDSIPDNGRIVVYIDKANQPPVIYQIDAKHGKQVWKTYEEDEDCTDSLTMLRNLKLIMEHFPARHYGLTISAHGTGWQFKNRVKRKALGYDTTNGTKWVNIPTLRGILEQLPHTRYILFDACFMQSVEVAYELHDVTDWIIGSPAEIPGTGAPFHLITKAMVEGDVDAITERYRSYYPHGYFLGVVLSAVRCDRMELLAKATKRHIVEKFANHSCAEETYDIQKYASRPAPFTYCYDVNSMMYHILGEEEYAKWAETFVQAVPLRAMSDGSWTSYYCNENWVSDTEHYGGISMFIPDSSTTKSITEENMGDIHKLRWYKAAGWDTTGW